MTQFALKDNGEALIKAAQEETGIKITSLEYSDVTDQLDYAALRIHIYLTPEILDDDANRGKLSQLEDAMRKEIYKLYPEEQPFAHFRYYRAKSAQ